jgi:uncharacterized membrane protein
MLLAVHHEHLDPTLYATAATVIPVFWLGLVYQSNAYDLLGKKKPKNVFAPGSLLVVTLAALFGEIHAFGALFDTRLASSARSAVAWGLYLPGAFLFALPAWQMFVRELKDTVWSIVVSVLIMGGLAYGAVYVQMHT